MTDPRCPYCGGRIGTGRTTTLLAVVLVAIVVAVILAKVMGVPL